VGTTIFELGQLMKTRTKITVIVTSLPLAQTLSTQPGIELIIIGGKYRSSELSMVGYIAESELRNFYVDKVFLGAAGIHPKMGITEYSVEQAGTKKVMIEQARQRIVLTDHTKFGKVRLAAVCPVSRVDIILTDTGLSPEAAEKYRQLGVKLVTV
jgi:DeoR/GlpR family transcriptional regulator of sugar metabolism